MIIDEYFGALGTAYGGYGFLARRLIAKYVPNHDIQIDVLLGRGVYPDKAIVSQVDEGGVNVYLLPNQDYYAQQWLAHQNYQIYLSIELVDDYVLRNDPDPDKKLILWIQDPRPYYEWDEINTVELFKETCYYNQRIYDLVHRWHQSNKVRFVSQARFLNQKAIDLYQLNQDVDIRYLPNPIEIDLTYNISDYQKKNKIIFLGRLESVKRGWLFCEIAKLVPEYEFYVLGQLFRESSQNSAIFAQYQNIENLHFVGHVDGEQKNQFLKEAAILVNTSIHEALPISFLEALSYGVLLVSNRNPDDLTSRFGIHVGDVLGDGFDKVPLFADAIRKLMSDLHGREQLAHQAIGYVRQNHQIERFSKELRAIIKHEYQQAQVAKERRYFKDLVDQSLGDNTLTWLASQHDKVKQCINGIIYNVAVLQTDKTQQDV